MFSRRPWRVLSYAPFFFLFAFAGRFIVLAGSGEEIPFDTALGGWGYPAWFGLGIACPLLLLMSWRFVLRGGRWLYPGLWLRLAADLGMVCALAAFILAYTLEHVKSPLDDSHLLALTLMASIWVFLVVSAGWDVWRIVAQDNLAARIRADE